MIERREDTKYGDDRIGYLVRRECIATQLFAGMLAQHNVVNPVFAYQSPTPQLAIHFADLLIEALDSDARSSPVHEPIAENAEKQGVSYHFNDAAFSNPLPEPIAENAEKQGVS